MSRPVFQRRRLSRRSVSVSSKQPRTPGPPPPEAETLFQQLVRDRLLTEGIVEQLPGFETWRKRRIHALLRRFRREGLLLSPPLHHGERYWCLSRRGAERCGLAAARGGPLSEPAKLRAYALLRFCWCSEQRRSRLTLEDLARTVPGLSPSGHPHGYYFDPADGGRIGLARLDAHRLGRWDRSIERLRVDISRHWREPGFSRLIQARRFEITLLTVFPEKAERIAAALGEHADARRLPVRCVALPELLPLVSGLRRKEVRPRAPR